MVAFLKHYPAFFTPDVNDQKATDSLGRTPSARSWNAFFNALAQRGGIKHFEKTRLYPTLSALAKATLFERAASAFASYLKDYDIYPSPADLFNDPTLWNNLPDSHKHLLSGAIGAAHGMRSYFIDAVSKNPDDAKLLTTKLLTALQVISKTFKEVHAYVVGGIRIGPIRRR